MVSVYRTKNILSSDIFFVCGDFFTNTEHYGNFLKKEKKVFKMHKKSAFCPKIMKASVNRYSVGMYIIFTKKGEIWFEILHLGTGKTSLF
jgi:membrane-bound inhibitor of C-type lysozyme